MNDIARRAINDLRQAALDGTTDALKATADQLYAEGARDQEAYDRKVASAMLAEAGLDEQLILKFFNRYWSTTSDEGVELVREGQVMRLDRYMFDLGIKGGKANHFLKTADAYTAFKDPSFRRLKVEKQFSKLLEVARRNGWDE